MSGKPQKYEYSPLKIQVFNIWCFRSWTAHSSQPSLL